MVWILFVLMPKEKFEVSKESKEFIRSFEISENEVISALDLLFSWVGDVKHVKVDLIVDYEELDGKEKSWKNLKVSFCLQDISISEKTEIINKLSRDFYSLFPEIPTYFVVECPRSV